MVRTGKDHSAIPSLQKKQAREAKGICPRSQLSKDPGNSIIKIDEIYQVLSLCQAESFRCIILFNSYILIV